MKNNNRQIYQESLSDYEFNRNFHYLISQWNSDYHCRYTFEIWQLFTNNLMCVSFWFWFWLIQDFMSWSVLRIPCSKCILGKKIVMFIVDKKVKCQTVIYSGHIITNNIKPHYVLKVQTICLSWHNVSFFFGVWNANFSLIFSVSFSECLTSD